MYGKGPIEFPKRIVCLTAETAEIVYALGAGERVVGIPGTAERPPEVREKAKVGGFTTFRLDKILSLTPDLVLAFSDLQKDIVRDLVGAGIPLFATNQRSFDDILQTILMIGGVIGREAAARELIQDMQDEIRQMREFSSIWPDRPRVYFEEWPDPLIAGIRWVSEVIEIAGGNDIFPELREKAAASGRMVDPDEVVRRDPQIIVASWCGKKLEPERIRSRPGWDRVAAVKANRIYELNGADILAPGPSVMAGLRRLHEIVQGYMQAR
ncbi:MAG: cobalamin-binding protein [Candidatus Rokubacteria bacterium]|nr:cobalamin-binding protein [Candidatus Rokubacteria bacterium]